MILIGCWSIPLFTIYALQHMLCPFPGKPNDPLFRIPRSFDSVPFTDLLARHHLEFISFALGLGILLKFHDFQRLGPLRLFHMGLISMILRTMGSGNRMYLDLYPVYSFSYVTSQCYITVIPFLLVYPTTTYLAVWWFTFLSHPRYPRIYN